MGRECPEEVRSSYGDSAGLQQKTNTANTTTTSNQTSPADSNTHSCAGRHGADFTKQYQQDSNTLDRSERVGGSFGNLDNGIGIG